MRSVAGEANVFHQILKLNRWGRCTAIHRPRYQQIEYHAIDPNPFGVDAKQALIRRSGRIHKPNQMISQLC